MNKLKITIGVLIVVIIALGVYIVSSKDHTNSAREQDYSWHEGEVSPIVDPVDMVNAKGQHVEKKIKGTFREIGTGRIFESGELGSCIEDGCKRVYFTDCSYGTNNQNCDWLSYGYNDKDNAHVAVISDKKFSSSDGNRHTEMYSKTGPIPVPDDKVVYSINYNGKVLTFEQKLCSAFSDYKPHTIDGYQCGKESLEKGDRVYFILDSMEKIKSTLPAYGTATIADLLSYQYYTFPDTGEKYPVITIQK